MSKNDSSPPLTQHRVVKKKRRKRSRSSKARQRRAAQADTQNLARTSDAAATSDTGSSLLPQHASLIGASAIISEVIAARGYRSITNRSELKRLGFTAPQQIVPCLLIPIYDVHGEIATYQIRPDVPRIGKRGRPIKYETPKSSRMALDVPPMARPWLGDSARPLFITEGSRKADSAVSHGLCCIAVLGVWNWRGTNASGGKAALADWEVVALNNRDVFVAFDSDAMSKDEVRAALARLREFLISRGANVKIILLSPGEGGTKTGLDDYFAAGHDVAQLLAHATDVLPSPASAPKGVYESTDAGLVYHKEVQGGTVPSNFTNFTARISAQIEIDDGVETQLQFEIDAVLKGRSSQFRILGRQFVGMAWAVEHLGAEAIIYPGTTLRDHARTAIQSLSETIETQRIYSHLGWRLIGDCPIYLHAGGGIGAEGVVEGIELALPDSLGRYSLPPPPKGAELVRAVRKSLALLKVGPLRVTVPLLATVYRAPVGNADISAHLAGPTGGGKSAIAALAQQHHGAGLDAEHLPGSWSSTGNALEVLAFHAKDALLVVDDFVPRGTQVDVHRIHGVAERLMRAQGNSTGRQRLRPDGSLRPPKWPRGLVLSTGEEIPRGQSLRARTFVIEVSPGDLDWKAITAAQGEAAAGTYALALSAYIQWLAPRLGTVQSNLKTEIHKLRDEASGAGQHRRTPSVVANLAIGLRYFLEFAQDVGAISAAEAKDLWGAWWAALEEGARAQQRQIDHEEPTRRFFELLAAAVSGGHAHIASATGLAPPAPAVWGWREYHADDGSTYWREFGVRVGWIDGDNLYLEPEASYSVVQQQARVGGDSLTIASKTLHKRLFEEGCLLSRDEGRKSYSVRRQLQGARRSVLHVNAASLMSQGPDQPDQPDQPTSEGSEDGDSPEGSWSGTWSGQPTAPDQQPDQARPETPGRTAATSASGQVGQVGQVSGEMKSRPKSATDTPPERFEL